MLKIRLRRMGAIRQPHYRIVVADARAPRDGAFIESLGHYNPLTNPATIQVDVAKYEEWKRKGAQPTDAVASLVKQFNRANRANAVTTAEGTSTSTATVDRRTRTASGKRGAAPSPEPVAAAAAPAADEVAVETEAEAEPMTAPEVEEAAAPTEQADTTGGDSTAETEENA